MKGSKIKLNNTWKAWPSKKAPLSDLYYKNKDSANYWYDVKLPHNWDLDSRFNNDEYTVYYFNTFYIENDEPSKYILSLENIFNQFTLYVNGERVTKEKTYFLKSNVNITEYVTKGDNFLYLKVCWPINNNLDPLLGIYNNFEYGNKTQIYGGICGDISLNCYDSCYINSINIDYEIYRSNFSDVNVRFNSISDYSFDGILDWTLTPYNFDGKEFKGSEITSIKKGNSYTQFSF